MSQLNSLFDVVAGFPPQCKSALEENFKQKTGESPALTEGMVAKVVNESGAPVLTKLTSANISDTTPPDYPWMVIAGMDATDAAFANKVTAVAMKSGAIFKVPHATPGSFAVGDLVYANAGVLAVVTAAQQAVGQIIEINTTAGYVVIACGGSGT